MTCGCYVLKSRYRLDQTAYNDLETWDDRNLGISWRFLDLKLNLAGLPWITHPFSLADSSPEENCKAARQRSTKNPSLWYFIWHRYLQQRRWGCNGSQGLPYYNNLTAASYDVKNSAAFTHDGCFAVLKNNAVHSERKGAWNQPEPNETIGGINMRPRIEAGRRDGKYHYGSG